MGKGGWAASCVAASSCHGHLVTWSLCRDRVSPPAVTVSGSEAQALPVQAQGSTRPVSWGLRRHAMSRRRSWLSGCPGVWGLMPPFRPRRVVPAPQVAEGASEQGQASSRSHAALLWCLLWGSCEVLWAMCRWAREREVGVCREAGCPSCLQCPRRQWGRGTGAGTQRRCREEPVEGVTGERRALESWGLCSVEKELLPSGRRSNVWPLQEFSNFSLAAWPPEPGGPKV